MAIFQAVIMTIVNLKRTCPVCRKGQIVPTSKNRETVKCKFCGADIPPKK